MERLGTSGEDYRPKLRTTTKQKGNKMNELIKMGYTIAQIGLIALILTLVWTFLPILMVLLSGVGAYYVIASLLKIFGFGSKLEDKSND